MRTYEYSEILIHTDVVVYMILYKQANDLMWKAPFNMSIGVLAERAKISIASVKRSRDRLQKEGLIKWESRGGRQSANYWIIEPQHEPQHEPQYEPQYKCEPQCEPQHEPQSEKEPQIEPQSELQHEPRHEPIHKPINNINTNDTNIYVLGGKRFKKTTIEEIQNYLDEKNITSFSAEKFYNFYEANGWMIGKNKMKNWKACCNSWNLKDEKENKKDEPKKDKYEHLYLGYNEKESKRDEPKTDEYADLYL